MDSKQVQGMMEAYASIYEKKGDCVDKKDKGMHNCAKKVCHEEYGEGETIFGQHAVPDENGFVSHYNVQFEHGIVENVSVEELEIITEGSHNEENHQYEGETISEMGKTSGTGENQRVRSRMPSKTDQLPKRTPENAKNVEYYKDDVDVFDVIKGHLIDEGYANTEEAAFAIMANMSEEWKQSILEADQPVGKAKLNPDGSGTQKTTGGNTIHYDPHVDYRSKEAGRKGTRTSVPFSGTAGCPPSGCAF